MRLRDVRGDWKAVGTADFNNDGNTDVLWHNATTGVLSVWLLNRTGAVIGDQTLSWNCNAASRCSTDWRVVGTGDFNHDGNSDVLWHNAETGRVAAWLLNANGAVMGELSLSLTCNAASGCSRDWKPVGTGDFNGDGNTDLLWHNATTGGLAAWLLNGSGTVTEALGLSWTCSAASGCSRDWKPVGTGDFNGDGSTDLLWHNATTGRVTAWLLNRGGIVSGEMDLSWTCGAASGCSQAWLPVGTMR